MDRTESPNRQRLQDVEALEPNPGEPSVIGHTWRRAARNWRAEQLVLSSLTAWLGSKRRPGF